MDQKRRTSFLARLITTTLAVLVTTYLIPGAVINNVFTAFWIALALGILNILVKPLLILLTLPFTVLTLGLFLFVINAMMILLVSSLIPGFDIGGFWWALLYSVVLSLVVSILEAIQQSFG